MRLLWKVVVVVLLLLLFQLVGWLTFPGGHITLTADPVVNRGIEILIIAVVIAIAKVVLDFVFGLIIVATLGLGVLLWPVKLLLIGPILLWVAVALFSGWMIVTAGGGAIVIIGLIIGFVFWVTDAATEKD